MTNLAGAESLISQWESWLRAGGAPETTVYLRSRYVHRFAHEHPDVMGVSLQTVAEWVGGHRWSPSTKKSARSALRSFFGWAVQVGYVEASPAAGLPPIRVPRARPRPTLEADYLRALMAADERLRLAIRLAGQCGLRRGEIARTRREHVEPDMLGYSLRVVGKGGHVRSVPLPDDLAGEILQREPGWLFPSPQRPGQPLTAHHLSKLISALLPEGFSTHTLRHRCATSAYAATRDIRAVQELLGHSSPVITAIYAAVPNDAVRAAVVAASHVPEEAA